MNVDGIYFCLHIIVDCIIIKAKRHPRRQKVPSLVPTLPATHFSSEAACRSIRRAASTLWFCIRSWSTCTLCCCCSTSLSLSSCLTCSVTALILTCNKTNKQTKNIEGAWRRILNSVCLRTDTGGRVKRPWQGGSWDIENIKQLLTCIAPIQRPNRQSCPVGKEVD